RTSLGETSDAIPVHAGAAAVVVAEPEHAYTPADGVRQSELRVTVRDRFGNVAAGHDVRARIEGAEYAATEASPGAYRVLLPARTQSGAAEAVVVVAPRPWAGRPASHELIGRTKVAWRLPTPSLALELLGPIMGGYRVCLVTDGVVDASHIRVTSSRG